MLRAWMRACYAGYAGYAGYAVCSGTPTFLGFLALGMMCGLVASPRYRSFPSILHVFYRSHT